MGGRSKLLLPLRGRPLVRWAAEALVRAGLAPVVVVVGPDEPAVKEALEGLPVRFAQNPRAAEGMGTSLAAGVSALGAGVEGVAVALGDMPLLDASLVSEIVLALERSGKTIAVPVCEGRRGHPVVFDLRRHRRTLLALSGDQGARAVLSACPDEVLEVPTDDRSVLLDVDTPEDLHSLTASSVEAAGPAERPPVPFDEKTVLEINTLWEPVYPFMVDHLLSASGLSQGRLLDLGPFAGGMALNLLWRSEAFLASVVDASPAVLRWVEQRAAEGGYVSRLTTRLQAIEPIPEPSSSFDLVAVRGAFFFLTPRLLREVRRVLRPGGFAWVGGGYGPSTPQTVIAPIADRSRDLNAALGKRLVSEAEARALVAEAGLAGCARVSTAGGLWIEVTA